MAELEGCPAARARRRSNRVPEAQVEEPKMTVFIDVIFQLLIFFMLSIKFKQQEGYLLSILPKDHGPDPSPAPYLTDVRLNICADMNRRMDQHIGYKERHQDFIRDQKKAGHAVGDVCYAQLELNFADQVPLYRTEKFPGRWGHNRQAYADLAGRAKVLFDICLRSLRPQDKAKVVLDLDGHVPFEHAIGLLTSLQRLKINDTEWAMNPRFDRYFGPTSDR